MARSAVADRIFEPDILTAELLAALRGKRSRAGFSRFLGYRSNSAQRWEGRLCAPAASELFAILARQRLSPGEVVERFLRRRPAWLAGANLETAAGVGLLLEELRGATTVVEVARRSGLNRFSLARWFRGEAEPRLPEFLWLVEVLSRRSLDFLASFVDPGRLPSVAARWKALQFLREGALQYPLSHAVLRALELTAYGSAPDPEVFLAQATGLDLAAVKTQLAYLQATGQVRKRQGRYWPVASTVVDTGADPARSRQVRIAWGRLALDRLAASAPGTLGYSLFSVSRADLRRLEELQQRYLREMQQVIAASEGPECVGLYCVQLLALEGAGGG